MKNRPRLLPPAPPAGRVPRAAKFPVPGEKAGGHTLM